MLLPPYNMIPVRNQKAFLFPFSRWFLYTEKVYCVHSKPSIRLTFRKLLASNRTFCGTIMTSDTHTSLSHSPVDRLSCFFSILFFLCCCYAAITIIYFLRRLYTTKQKCQYYQKRTGKHTLKQICRWGLTFVRVEQDRK